MNRIHFPPTIQWHLLRDIEIAQQMGVSLSSVANYRRRRDLPKAPRKPGSGAPPKIRPSLIRWTYSVGWNAKNQNVSYNHMAVVMRQLKAQGRSPHTPADPSWV